MFVVNEDNSIYATRGDIVFFYVNAEDDGEPYQFEPGDVVRIKVYGKKDAETVYLQRDFPVLEITEKVKIYLSEEDTKIGEVISKPTDYWYEVELNPDTAPRTIIGYDEDGAKVFKLFPEGNDVAEYALAEVDISEVDEDLDLASNRPVQNQAVARAVAKLGAEFKKQTGELVANIHNSEGFIQKIVDVCKTYTDNFSKLVYGNVYTAYDTKTQQVNGKWQMDCSSFLNLLIRGVTFENSRYAGNAENKVNPLFFNKFDPYEFRLANTMAKWLYDNGYTFAPNADFSNIEPGDLVFYSWKDTTGEFHENAFMHIDHVAMFLQKKNATVYQTIQYEEDTPSFFYDVGKGYMSDAVLVARLPFQMVENTGDNIALDSNKTVSLVGSNEYKLGEWELVKPMKPGKMYTCCFKGNAVTEGAYFLLQSSDYETIFSDSGDSWDGKEREYKFSFICPEGLTDYTKLFLMCTGGASRTAYAKNFCVYEGFKRFYTDSTIPVTYPIMKKFDLASDIASDLESNMAASSYVLEYKDCYLLSLNIPLKTLRSGQLLLGKLGVRVSETRRLHANLVADENGIISHYNGYLQISSGSATGDVYINTWNSSHKYQYIMVNGMIAK